MVDDHLMKITHVIRGSEWLPTFPLHSLLYRAFGWEEPIFLHLSIFLKPSGKGKMSKRDAAEASKDGYSTFISELKELGYLPEAVDNWIALMGWSFDDHTEFFTMKDLVEKFSIDHLNPSPAAINFTKFDHFNGLHIRALSDDDLAERIEPFFKNAGYTTTKDTLLKIAPLLKERLATLDDAVEMAGFFFKDSVKPLVEDLIQKGLTMEQTLQIAQETENVLKSQSTVEITAVEPPMRELVEKLGYSVGQVFGVLRVAVTGQRVSPPLFESMEIIGREKVLERINNAIDLLS
jgi:glutamyl-tRNA synthetase